MKEIQLSPDTISLTTSCAFAQNPWPLVCNSTRRLEIPMHPIQFYDIRPAVSQIPAFQQSDREDYIYSIVLHLPKVTGS